MAISMNIKIITFTTQKLKKKTLKKKKKKEKKKLNGIVKKCKLTLRLASSETPSNTGGFDN